MNGYIRRSFWVPLVASMKQQGLVVDADTANREMRTWLRDVANVRIHGTTGCVPALALQQERTHLLAIPSAYSGRTVRQMQKVTGGGAAVRPIPAAAWRGLQHPLAMYDTLVHNQAAAGGRP